MTSLIQHRHSSCCLHLHIDASTQLTTFPCINMTFSLHQGLHQLLQRKTTPTPLSMPQWGSDCAGGSILHWNQSYSVQREHTPSAPEGRVPESDAHLFGRTSRLRQEHCSGIPSGLGPVPGMAGEHRRFPCFCNLCLSIL